MTSSKKNNFLSVYTTFMVVWWCFSGFTFAFNGVISNLFGGRINIFLFLIFVIVYFAGRSIHPEMFKGGDKKIAQLFLLINAAIYFLAFLLGGKLIPGDFVIFAVIGGALLSYNEETRHRIFDLFLWFLIPLWTLSLLEYILFALTGQGIILGMVERRFDTGSGQTQVFVQTMFNLIRYDQALPRFQSLFEEPGGIGNVAILILFLTGGKRKYLYAHIVTWVAGILSFGLGFYFLALVYLLSLKLKVKYLIFPIILLIGLVNVPQFMEFYDNLIVSRVDGKTIEEIDNRSSTELDLALEKSFQNGTIWLGNGGDLPRSFQYYGGVSGGKPFVYKYGIIMTILSLGLYINEFLKKSKKYNLTWRKRLSFLAVFLLSFYKSAVLFFPYFVLMFFLYPYVSSLSEEKMDKMTR